MWGGSRAVNKYSGQNYKHRRGGVENRLLFLAGIFAIDSAATVFVLTTGCVCMTSVGKRLNNKDLTKTSKIERLNKDIQNSTIVQASKLHHV
jgi:hypothetical protein